MKNRSSYIHPSAIIYPSAIIGENVTIGPFVFIDNNTVICDGTYIYPSAIILDGARIGKNCQIFPGAIVSAIPQDLKFKGEKTICEIGEGTVLREHVTINRGTSSRGKTVVGNNCLLMAYSHTAHDCILKNNVILGNAVQLAGEVMIDDFAIISGGSLAHQFTHIGKHVMVQGGSKIIRDIPPYIIAAREPVIFSGINVVGLKRRGFSNVFISTIQEIYHLLYQSGLNRTSAIKQIQDSIDDTKEKKEILEFLLHSQRGIIRGYLE